MAASPFSWYGGKFGKETIPFAQFGVDPDVFFTIYNEFNVPADQLKAFQQDKTSCAIGRKLTRPRLEDRRSHPLERRYLSLQSRFDRPRNLRRAERRNLRVCYFHWGYLDEGLKRDYQGKQAGNAGVIMVKCKTTADMTRVGKAIDDITRNSDRPTKTQSEEAFVAIFADMLGDLKTLIMLVGLAVGVALLCVSGVAMAMTIRERTTEVAVLKAIGFRKGLILRLVLAEAIIVTFCGGILGALGAKLFYDLVDVAPFTAGFLPFFYIPWPTTLFGLGVSIAIGLASGLLPAWRGQPVGGQRLEEGRLTPMVPFKYNIRNLRARRVTTLLTVLGVGMVVWSSCLLFGLVNGLRHTMNVSGEALDLIILRKGSTTEINSSFEEDTARLGQSRRPAHDEQGKPLCSAENVDIPMAERVNGSRANLIIRGVDPIAVNLRSNFTIVSGRMFEQGRRRGDREREPGASFQRGGARRRIEDRRARKLSRRRPLHRRRRRGRKRGLGRSQRRHPQHRPRRLRLLRPTSRQFLRRPRPLAEHDRQRCPLQA